ncbi:unannotated protein [freshwater metagenome]|uniref:Unannotated protein n=1 Tax=freshwater metagenome TaxID=449393 RepID=A0A6J7KYU3_9ZZZZ
MTPPLSGAARASRAAGSSMMPRSCSQRIAEPAVSTCPSMQYSVAPLMLHATDVVSPVVERTASTPVLARRKAPVPYVHFAMPGSRHASASSAAC